MGRVVDWQELRDVLDRRRENGDRVVFTNGCFDLLHVGHIRTLAHACEFGDLLVVGLNTDRSVRALKGPGRPVVPERERAEILAALRAVDYVTLFDEPLPTALIEVVRPAVHVKGGDYRAEDLPETPVVEQLGGRVEIIPLIGGLSTTTLIARLREEA